MLSKSEEHLKESLVSLQNSQGVELRGCLLRLTRFMVGFEVYNANGVIRLSEVLSQFRIIFQDRAIYSGRAVIESLVNTGLTVVCEASLDEAAWMDVHFDPGMNGNGSLPHEFSLFIEEWQKLYTVANDYKVIVADMQSFFADLRLWLNQIELGVRSAPSGDRLRLEQSVATELAEPVIKLIDAFIERFEVAAENLKSEVRPSHRAYLRRQLHPLVLCSPFAYRAYHKPLGYPGDYELINMMMRSPCEGSTLFAKVLNIWLLGQVPVRAHRNRIAHIKTTLRQEVLRGAERGQIVKIFNLGCGPAREIQEFMVESDLTRRAQFSLLDFNEETLDHTRQALNDAMNRGHRPAAVQLMRKSVAQVLKEAAKPSSSLLLPEYDFVYCAGLFDYLPDSICEKILAVLYRMVAPGGLLLATNVSDSMNWSRPFRHSMDYILDWHLIYRNGMRMQALAAPLEPQDACRVYSEETGVNVFMEVRKPHHA